MTSDAFTCDVFVTNGGMATSDATATSNAIVMLLIATNDNVWRDGNE